MKPRQQVRQGMKECLFEPSEDHFFAGIVGRKGTLWRVKFDLYDYDTFLGRETQLVDEETLDGLDGGFEARLEWAKKEKEAQKPREVKPKKPSLPANQLDDHEKALAKQMADRNVTLSPETLEILKTVDLSTSLDEFYNSIPEFKTIKPQIVHSTNLARPVGNDLHSLVAAFRHQPKAFRQRLDSTIDTPDRVQYALLAMLELLAPRVPLDIILPDRLRKRDPRITHERPEFSPTDRLPMDVAKIIFGRFDTRTLRSFIAVCSSWCRIIKKIIRKRPKICANCLNDCNQGVCTYHPGALVVLQPVPGAYPPNIKQFWNCCQNSVNSQGCSTGPHTPAFKRFWAFATDQEFDHKSDPIREGWAGLRLTVTLDKLHGNLLTAHIATHCTMGTKVHFQKQDFFQIQILFGASKIKEIHNDRGYSLGIQIELEFDSEVVPYLWSQEKSWGMFYCPPIPASHAVPLTSPY